jgi:hypothetical protein
VREPAERATSAVSMLEASNEKFREYERALCLHYTVYGIMSEKMRRLVLFENASHITTTLIPAKVVN